jgi:hypothetical protein
MTEISKLRHAARRWAHLSYDEGYHNSLNLNRGLSPDLRYMDAANDARHEFEVVLSELARGLAESN